MRRPLSPLRGLLACESENAPGGCDRQWYSGDSGLVFKYCFPLQHRFPIVEGKVRRYWKLETCVPLGHNTHSGETFAVMEETPNRTGAPCTTRPGIALAL